MHTTALISTLGLLALSTAAPSSSSGSISPYKRQATDNCVQGNAVHIIAARGSTQEPGEGSLITVSDLIEAAIPGSDSIGVMYPADLFPYGSSQNAGVVNMTQMIRDYTAACPDSQIVLLGFSQGGHIVGDVLGGATNSDLPPLDAESARNIVAAVSFASPAHVEGKPYNAGTSNGSGIFEREDTAALDAYADRFQDICDENDLFCDGEFSIDAHTSTVDRNAQSAADFVVGLATA